MSWQTVERPGYFGRDRGRKYSEFDARLGKGQWRIAWQIGARIGEFDEATMLYEDSYMVYLQQRPDLLRVLVYEASDVYDEASSNTASGLDYASQESLRNHVQDIAIRRCIVRLGLNFMGRSAIQIRDAGAADPVHPLSLELSPGRVPFVRLDWIVQPELAGWWGNGSVEAFYQSNKLIQHWRPEKYLVAGASLGNGEQS